MSKKTLHIVLLLLALGCLFTPNHVAAQGANTKQFTLGDRAFGLAGSFAALADDATAGWYNPGGLGLLYNSYLNASGNAYYWESYNVPYAGRINNPENDITLLHHICHGDRFDNIHS